MGVACGIPTGLALSQLTHQMHVETLLRVATGEIPRPANLEVRQDRWDPGAETGVHQHPGPVILAVIEGELIEETKAGRSTLSSGQVVWRAAGQQHNVRNVSDKPARVLVVSTMLAPEINEFPDSGIIWARTYPPGAQPGDGAVEVANEAGGLDPLALP